MIGRLLLVEDEPLVAFDTEHVLTEADYTIVATVDRVSAALRVMDETRDVDLVLCDVNLADGSGIDVARAAKAKGLPVIFVTGSCPVEGMEIAAGCLSKPFAPRGLLAAIGAVDTVMQGGTPKRLPPGFKLFMTVAEPLPGDGRGG